MADHGFKTNKDIVDLNNYIESWYTNKLNKMFPVGSIISTMSTVTPATMGYPGNWVKLAGGRVLVSKSDNANDSWNKNPGTMGGASGVPFHTHTIFATEEWPNHETVSDEQRQIYADLIPANNPGVDREASAAGGDIVRRLVFHSKNDSATQLETDVEYGKLELVETYPNTKLKGDSTNYPSPNNPIKASNVGNAATAGQYDLGYPPFYIVNVWRRNA